MSLPKLNKSISELLNIINWALSLGLNSSSRWGRIQILSPLILWWPLHVGGQFSKSSYSDSISPYLVSIRILMAPPCNRSILSNRFHSKKYFKIINCSEEKLEWMEKKKENNGKKMKQRWKEEKKNRNKRGRIDNEE